MTPPLLLLRAVLLQPPSMLLRVAPARTRW